MRESCRICGRELCGNQRRWIFHTAAKLNLQVLLSHVLGKEISRDGKNEFICSKCAFMLERIYRFDTVIARIEALSIERLQKLMLEKDRLKLCIAGIYRKNNEQQQPSEETTDVSSLSDLRYSALLQEDFAYSVYECWTDPEERAMDPQAAESRPRRCRSCAVLRVADADYEAICKIPRKVARNVSCGSSPRCSANVYSEESPICEPVIIADLLSGKEPLDEESLEGETAESSLESLNTTAVTSTSHAKDEEVEAEAKRSATTCNNIDDCGAHSLSLQGNRLDAALSLVKAFDCKPVQIPRGSKLPVPIKSSPHCQDLLDKSPYSGCLTMALKSQSALAFSLPMEISDLQELWEDLCMDYVPLRIKNLCETNQLTHSDMSFGENETGLNCAKCIEKISCSNAMNKVQEELNEMNFKLKSVQHANQRQDHIIQKLNETLKIKENECEEQNHVIEKQNERITKLQEMLHKSQLEQLQNSEGFSSLQQKQQTECLGAQNALFLSQLEVQRLKWTQQQKDHQLAEARSSNQFLERVLQEEQLQKETAWKHSKEVCATLQQLKTDLQNMNIHCSTLEKEKLLEMHRRDQKIMHLTYTLAFKEQLLQESQDLLQYHQNLEKNSTTAEKTIQKLQQLIKDKDAALKQAVDEKFCALEDKDQGMNQLYLSLKEQGHDLEGLRQVVSSNMATIQGLESLLKAKDLELEKLLATYNNLQWMMKNIEAKSQRWQAEQKGIVQQLQTAMLEQKKEVEAFSATLMCSLEPGQRDLVENLYLHLQQKDQIIAEVLSEKSHQAVEQVAELQGLLQSAGTRDQQSYVHCREIAQAPIEINGELQVPHQQLIVHNLKQKPEISTIQIVQNKSIEALTQDSSGKNNIAKMDKDDLNITSTLERELTKAKEELELLAQKERESRLELSTLQSVVASQEEELQVQASDIESLTRSIKIKEELIKDLQMQLVDPEELPAIEQLTQEVLMLKEKVVKMELQGQEAVGCKKQQLLRMLEGLVAEKNQLNETLKVEKQIYCTLTKGHPNSSSRQEQTLEVELEKVQALRGELEEAIGRSQELLSRLESLESIGGGEQERVTVLPKHAF